MKIWLDEEGNIVYQHYKKPMASKQVISARSAHAEYFKERKYWLYLGSLTTLQPQVHWQEALDIIPKQFIDIIRI